MEENQQLKAQILNVLKNKSQVKYKVFDNSVEAFKMLKHLLAETEKNLNAQITGLDSRVKLEYKENGSLEVHLKIASDLLVFNLHSNIFEFSREHSIWKTSFAQDPLNTYCGIISIYDFLNDSFKYNRTEDLGYLIARIFINKDMNFMVEGKRQLGFLYNDFANQQLNAEKLSEIIDTAILYALEFDLLIPPYETVKTASVEQINQAIENSKMQTAKRLGFKFNSDDVGSK